MDKGLLLNELYHSIDSRKHFIKVLVQIMNKPLLERTIIKLRNYGITEIVISSCYKSRYIKDYFGDGRQLGIKIEYIIEDLPLGTGGAIKNAESLLDDTFLVFNADIVSDIDIIKFVGFHKNSQATATIAVTEVDNPSVYGAIESNADGYAVSFIEKPKPEEILSNFINAGIYMFEPEMFKKIPANSVVSIERETFPKVLESGNRLAVYKDNGYWADIGTLEKYMQVHMDIMNGKCKHVECGNTCDNINIGTNVEIHPHAEIIRPAYIGNNVSIGAKAVIRNSVIGDNVKIDAESRIEGSILWNDISISRKVKMCNSIVVSNSFISRNLNLLDTVYARKNIPLYVTS